MSSSLFKNYAEHIENYTRRRDLEEYRANLSKLEAIIATKNISVEKYENIYHRSSHLLSLLNTYSNNYNNRYRTHEYQLSDKEKSMAGKFSDAIVLIVNILTSESQNLQKNKHLFSNYIATNLIPKPTMQDKLIGFGLMFLATILAIGLTALTIYVGFMMAPGFHPYSARIGCSIVMALLIEFTGLLISSIPFIIGLNIYKDNNPSRDVIVQAMQEFVLVTDEISKTDEHISSTLNYNSIKV